MHSRLVCTSFVDKYYQHMIPQQQDFRLLNFLKKNTLINTTRLLRTPTCTENQGEVEFPVFPQHGLSHFLLCSQFHH